LWFRKIGIKYQTYQGDGSGKYTYGPAQMSGWDQVTNKAWAPSDADFK
jgi:hypothetical protein